MSGYTPVPHDVLDRLMAELDPYTFVVYLKVVRETLGWHRAAAPISLSQFQQATGIAKRNVIVAALRALEAQRLIQSTQAPGVTTSYQLVTTGYPQLVTVGDQPVTAGYQPPVTAGDPALVTAGYPTKETGKITLSPEEEATWQQAREALRGQMSRLNWGLHIDGLRLVGRVGDEWQLQAPTHGEHVALHTFRWAKLVAPALGAVVGHPVTVRWVPPGSRAASG